MNRRSDAALRSGLRFGQIRREFAPTSPYLRERSSPVRLTLMSRPVFTGGACPSEVMDARAALGKKPPSRDIGGGRALSRKRTQNGVLALGRLISFGFRKERHQADASDAP
jgi:hypothetical protein